MSNTSDLIYCRVYKTILDRKQLEPHLELSTQKSKKTDLHPHTLSVFPLWPIETAMPTKASTFLKCICQLMTCSYQPREQIANYLAQIYKAGRYIGQSPGIISAADLQIRIAAIMPEFKITAKTVQDAWTYAAVKTQCVFKVAFTSIDRDPEDTDGEKIICFFDPTNGFVKFIEGFSSLYPVGGDEYILTILNNVFTQGFRSTK